MKYVGKCTVEQGVYYNMHRKSTAEEVCRSQLTIRAHFVSNTPQNGMTKARVRLHRNMVEYTQQRLHAK